MKGHGLFWKMSLPVLALFAVAIIVLIIFIPRQMEQNTIDSVVLSSQQTVKQFKTLRKYYTQNIIKKVLAGQEIRPAINHSGQAGKVPLPATMIHDLSALLGEQGMSLQLYSKFPFPNRESRQLNQFQSEAWDQLTQDANKVHVGERIENGEKVVSVAIADLMVADACVGCHNGHPDTPKNDWKLGDVRGVLQVDSNIEKQLSAGRLTSYKIVGVLMAVLVLIMLAIFLVFKKTIGSRIDQLNAAMDDIAEGEGDLTRELKLTGNDEIQHLATSFNTFVGKIREIIKQASNASHEVANLAGQMNSSTNQAKEGVARQRQETDMVATSINEMSATIQEVAQSAVMAADSAEVAHQAAGEGQQVVSKTMESIRSLASEVEEASSVIGILKGETENIGSVVEVINSIADQTNLLALNAAIEAARAGEQGRGFAVVADEVRSLASRTQASTKEIQDMMVSLQQGTDNAVEVMERGRSQATNSVDQVASAGESLRQIVESITQILDQNRQIASATEEQGAVSHEIERSIASINGAAESTSEVADSTARSSEQLARLASQLEELIGRFRA
ncbi:MAG: methyl-accepting chemotaxis protein [Motiliproteus sp.]|nr:methyl-accepting chemotaxis protein [Motiliproteus sp.]